MRVLKKYTYKDKSYKLKVEGDAKQTLKMKIKMITSLTQIKLMVLKTGTIKESVFGLNSWFYPFLNSFYWFYQIGLVLGSWLNWLVRFGF